MGVCSLASGADEPGEDDDGLTFRNTFPYLHPGARKPLRKAVSRRPVSPFRNGTFAKTFAKRAPRCYEEPCGTRPPARAFHLEASYRKAGFVLHGSRIRDGFVSSLLAALSADAEPSQPACFNPWPPEVAAHAAAPAWTARSTWSSGRTAGTGRGSGPSVRVRPGVP